MLSLSLLILAVICYLVVALAAILYEHNHTLDALPRSRQLALAASLLMLTGSIISLAAGLMA